jgi:hypothetical protein
MQRLIKKSRNIKRANEQYLKTFKNSLYWVIQNIDDFERLKRVFNEKLYPYIKNNT